MAGAGQRWSQHVAVTPPPPTACIQISQPHCAGAVRSVGNIIETQSTCWSSTPVVIIFEPLEWCGVVDIWCGGVQIVPSPDRLSQPAAPHLSISVSSGTLTLALHFSTLLDVIPVTPVLQSVHPVHCTHHCCTLTVQSHHTLPN